MALSVDRAKLSAQLVQHEGLQLTVYRCPTGHLTVGVGHNLEADPAVVGRMAPWNSHCPRCTTVRSACVFQNCSYQQLSGVSNSGEAVPSTTATAASSRLDSRIVGQPPSG